MSTLFPAYDVNDEAEVREPLDFNRRSRLKHVDQVFKAEMANVIRLTEMEKLFQVRLLEAFEFLFPAWAVRNGRVAGIR
jgi:hypothetical protein